MQTMYRMLFVLKINWHHFPNKNKKIKGLNAQARTFFKRQMYVGPLKPKCLSH
jgi:hypothetical protein